MGRTASGIWTIALTAILAWPSAAAAQPRAIIPNPCPLPVALLCNPPPQRLPFGSPPTQAPSVPVSQGDQATNYLENPARTGYAADDSVAPPLYKVWTHPFDNQLTYPLIAQGRVFVVVSGVGAGGSGLGARVFALSLRSGRTIWHASFAGSSSGAMLAYDAGRVLVVSSSGVVRALSATTGRSLWQLDAPGAWYSQPPIASGGSLYLVSYDSNVLTAIDDRSGRVQWQTRVMAQYGSSIAVDAQRVYIDSCQQVAAYARSSGALEWSRPAACITGPFGATVLGGELAADDGSRILDAATGAQLGTFPYSQIPPVVAGRLLIVGTGVGSQPPTLEAIDTQKGAVRWRRRSPFMGFSQPIVIGRDMFLSDDTRIDIFDVATGRPRGSAPIADGLGYSGHGGPPVAMAAAAGYLVVPDQTELSAYVGLFAPGSNGVGVREAPYVTVFGSRRGIAIDGRLGSLFRRNGAAPIVLSSEPFPQRRFHRIARGWSFADGGFTFHVRPSRNTYYGVVPARGRAHTSALLAFVYPRSTFHFSFSRPTRLIDGSVRLRFDPGIGLVGRAAYLYLDRVGSHRLVRLAAGTLTGSPGRALLNVSFPPVRTVGPHDGILWCVPHMTRLGLGFPDILDARCGQRTIHYR